MKEIHLGPLLEEVYEEALSWAQDEGIEEDFNVSDFTESDTYRHEILPELRKKAGFEDKSGRGSHSQRKKVEVNYLDDDVGPVSVRTTSDRPLDDIQLAWRSGVADAKKDRYPGSSLTEVYNSAYSRYP